MFSRVSRYLVKAYRPATLPSVFPRAFIVPQWRFFSTATKPATAESTKGTVDQMINDITIQEVLKHLSMENFAHNINTPPPLSSLPAHVGVLTVKELILLSNEDMRALIPASVPRNRLKEHLRLLAGGPIGADGHDVTIVATTAAAVSEEVAAKTSTTALIKNVTMPELLPNMTDGLVTEWHVKVGDTFDRGDALCTIDIDIAEISFDAAEPGHLSEIISPAGTRVRIGDTIAVQTYHEA